MTVLPSYRVSNSTKRFIVAFLTAMMVITCSGEADSQDSILTIKTGFTQATAIEVDGAHYLMPTHLLVQPVAINKFGTIVNDVMRQEVVQLRLTVNPYVSYIVEQAYEQNLAENGLNYRGIYRNYKITATKSMIDGLVEFEAVKERDIILLNLMFDSDTSLAFQQLFLESGIPLTLSWTSISDDSQAQEWSPSPVTMVYREPSDCVTWEGRTIINQCFNDVILDYLIDIDGSPEFLNPAITINTGGSYRPTIRAKRILTADAVRHVIPKRTRYFDFFNIIDSSPITTSIYIRNLVNFSNYLESNLEYLQLQVIYMYAGEKRSFDLGNISMSPFGAMNDSAEFPIHNGRGQLKIYVSGDAFFSDGSILHLKDQEYSTPRIEITEELLLQP